MPHSNYQDRREYNNKYARERRERDPEFAARQNQRSREWSQRKCAADPDYSRAKNYRRVVSRYGLTIEQYEAMLAAQDYKCAICFVAHVDEKGRRLYIDHDHDGAMAAVRGLLCSKCNFAIGLFDEDAEKMKRAMEYLERYRGR